jgi:hypothetical protein
MSLKIVDKAIAHQAATSLVPNLIDKAGATVIIKAVEQRGASKPELDRLELLLHNVSYGTIDDLREVKKTGQKWDAPSLTNPAGVLVQQYLHEHLDVLNPRLAEATDAREALLAKVEEIKARGTTDVRAIDAVAAVSIGQKAGSRAYVIQVHRTLVDGAYSKAKVAKECRELLKALGYEGHAVEVLTPYPTTVRG